ncbi:MAG: hypothetical protein EOO28_08885 [Comamonadaceae bacterium]|nr:MAG: hypothetical protein EOO28_08885 [Comamonadaceae bacterium]
MQIVEGNFFPPEFKYFPFNPGDLLSAQGEDLKFSLSKVLTVERIRVDKGQSINIRGQIFEATEDDYLLVIGCAYGVDRFHSLEAAKEAAESGSWTVKFGHIPNRAPGAMAGQVRIGSEDVKDLELEGYWVWKAAFENGEVGIF